MAGRDLERERTIHQHQYLPLLLIAVDTLIVDIINQSRKERYLLREELPKLLNIFVQSRAQTLTRKSFQYTVQVAFEDEPNWP